MIFHVVGLDSVHGGNNQYHSVMAVFKFLWFLQKPKIQTPMETFMHKFLFATILDCSVFQSRNLSTYVYEKLLLIVCTHEHIINQILIYLIIGNKLECGMWI